MRDLAPLTERAAVLLLGEPNERLSSAKELRYGRKGSLCVDRARGIWHDHSSEEGGGLLDLVARETGATTHRACFEWLERAGLLPEGNGPGLSTVEREAIARRQDAERAARARAEREEHLKAAAKSARIWTPAKPANWRLGYLRRKRIKSHQARQYRELVLLPVMDFEGFLWSLQFIAADGSKRFLKGSRKAECFIPVTELHPNPHRVLICEGWATGATLAEAEPEALVLAAIDAGNLKSVAVQARRRWPNAELVVCADADPVGIRKGRAAAIAAGALLAVPEFPPGTDGTDFNDLAAVLAERGAA